jgi:hypothetical protein
MSRTGSLAMIAAAALIAGCGSREPSESREPSGSPTSFEEARALAASRDRLLLVDFSTEW